MPNQALVNEQLKKRKILVVATPEYWEAAHKALRLTAGLLSSKFSDEVHRMVGNQEIFFFPGDGIGEPKMRPAVLDAGTKENLNRLDELLAKISRREERVEREMRSLERVEASILHSLENAADSGEIEIRFAASDIPWLSQFLDLYCRIGIGQFEEIAHSLNLLPEKLNDEYWAIKAAIEDEVGAFKHALGYPSNASLGILHVHLAQSLRCAWDLKKVCDQRYALLRDEVEAELGIINESKFRGVQYDGLNVRASPDLPAPMAKAE